MSSELNFATLGLAQPLMRAVADAGYETPTPIQAQAIPLVLQGGDLLAAAQTGTGKTAGFTLPILHRLSASSAHARPGLPRCLVLVPTRELAAQVEDAVRTYGKYLPLKSAVVFGGVGIVPQIKTLRGKVDILVATPGRLLDHAGQRTVDLSGIEILVLDEADRMLDMGFIRDIRRVLAMLPAKRQNLLFSATFSDEIRALADGLLDKPACVEVARRNAASELVEQKVHLVPAEHKRGLLSHLIRHHDWRQVLVFTRTKHGANRLAQHLAADGIGAAAIHGNKSQSARTRALAEFKSGKLPVLVATDIAARGLDIDQLPQVVNFELPHVPEDYVHRIGRTGRAGSAGAAVSLVASDEIKLLTGIERLIKRSIERATVAGYEMSAAPRPAQGQAQHARPAPGGGHRPGPGNRAASGRHPARASNGNGNGNVQSPASAFSANGNVQSPARTFSANSNVQHPRSGASAAQPEARHAAPGQRRGRPGQRPGGNVGQPGRRSFGRG